MNQETLDFLIEDMVMTGSNGTPVVVLVDDYREQENLADAIIEKARSFGVEVISLRGFDITTQQLPSLESLRNQAAVLLIDAGQAGAFGPWLDAIREALPQLVRFLIVLIFKNDFPQFAKKSPAFTSWTKVTEIEKLVTNEPTPMLDDFNAEMCAIKKAFDMLPAEYIEAWKRGEIPDTHRNSVWLNLAYVATSREPK